MPTPHPSETQIVISEIDSGVTPVNVSRGLGRKALHLAKSLAKPDLVGANVVRGHLAERSEDLAAIPGRGAGLDMEDMDPAVVARAFALSENAQGNHHATLPQIQEAQNEESKYH